MPYSPRRRKVRPLRVKLEQETRNVTPQDRAISPKPSNRLPQKSPDHYIECAASLFTEIQETVLGKEQRPDGHRTGPVPGGGVYGVLVGKREPPALQVVAFRQLKLALPDSESLSSQGELAFAGLIASVKWEPRFSGLEPIGWFRTHADGRANLSLKDLDVFNKFFKEAWHIGLLLQPGASIRARFFLREPDLSLQPLTGYRDVLALPGSGSRIVVERSVNRPPPVAPQIAPTRQATPYVSRRSSPLIWPVAVLVAAVISFGSWRLLKPPPERTTASHRPRSVVPDDKQSADLQAENLWKSWQDELRRQQQSAQVSDTARPPVVPPENSIGQYLTPPTPQSDRIAPNASDPARDDPSALSKSTSTRAASGSSRQGALTSKNDRRAAASIPRSRTRESNAIASSSTPPRQASGFLAKSATPTPANAAAPPVRIADPPIRQADRPFEPPPSASARMSSPATPTPSIPQTPTPAAGPPPSTAVPPLPTAIPSPTRDVPSVPPPSQTAPQPTTPAGSTASARPPQAPSSGRVIWTGHLSKNQYLVFDRGEASIGSSSGGLPGRPVDVRVSPGDLTKDGMLVYTVSKPASSSTQESPGAHNGWNKTRYEWAPDRAADIEVVEAPGPENAWRRLVLRAKNPKHSIILIDWKERP